MYRSSGATSVSSNDLATAAGEFAGVSPDEIHVVGDLYQFTEELLKMLYRPSCNLICAGTANVDIAIAADRAEMKLVETVGNSPFAGDISSTLECVENDFDVIYVANPNRITGAGYSLADIENMAKAVGKGAVIVDEYYFDHYGITGLPLLDTSKNIVILRSFSRLCGIANFDAGFFMAGEKILRLIRDEIRLPGISVGARKMIMAATSNKVAAAFQLKEIHDESLRVAIALTKLGIQCRITPTDFVLMRVACPKDVGNYLTGQRVPIENLDGYPMMGHYMRYRVESRYMNDRLLEAADRMPPEYYRMSGFDRRAVTIRRRKATDKNSRRSGLDAAKRIHSKVKQRLTPVGVAQE